LAQADRALAQNLIVNGGTFTITPATDRTYDHICITGGAVVTVTPYAGGDKGTEGNLELIAGSVYVDSSSRIVARGAGYQARKCYHGDGRTSDGGGRGGCAVADSGGGGAHFGRGGRGTIDAPTAFPTHYEDNCDTCVGSACTHTWNEAGNQCNSLAACGVQASPCPGNRTGRICAEGPSVAGVAYFHDIYDPDFGAAGGDKGCRDNDAFTVVTGGAGGGRVAIVGLSHLSSVAASPCGPMGVPLTRGQVQRLPNDDTLVVETNPGRAFEVSRSGETVWEYVNPHRTGREQELVAPLLDVLRLPPDLPTDWVGEPCPGA